MKKLLLFAALVMGSLSAAPLVMGPAHAVQPDEILKDPALEARARAISKELRCLVCQNQSIDDSDDQTLAFVVERYGDFVLLRPPFKASTLVLWIGPALILLAGIIGVVLWHRRRRSAVAAAVAPLTEDERARVDALLAENPER